MDDTHSCEWIIKAGWLKTEMCGMKPTLRCPACDKWICVTHRYMDFAEVIPGWGFLVEGFVCSAACVARLKQSPDILKWATRGASHKTERALVNGL